MPLPVAVVVHYGRVEPTLECLGSLASLATPPDVIVVDNQNSSEELQGAAPTELDISWIEPGENLGFGEAVNRALQHVADDDRYDSLLVLNNDTRLRDGAIEALGQALQDDPRCALAAPRIIRDNGILWYGGGEIDWLRGSARVPGSGGPADSPTALQARRVDFVSGCALLARKSALGDVGGFDRRYFLYEEDVELSLRLQRAGWHLRYVPEAVVEHSGQASQRDDDEPFVPIHDPKNPRSSQLIELQVCNRLLTMTRHAQGTQRLQFGFGFPAYWLARCAIATVRGKPSAFAAAMRGVNRYRRLRSEPA